MDVLVIAQCEDSISDMRFYVKLFVWCGWDGNLSESGKGILFIRWGIQVYVYACIPVCICLNHGKRTALGACLLRCWFSFLTLCMSTYRMNSTFHTNIVPTKGMI